MDARFRVRFSEGVLAEPRAPAVVVVTLQWVPNTLSARAPPQPPSRTRASVNRIFHEAPNTPRTVPEIFERPVRRR